MAVTWYRLKMILSCNHMKIQAVTESVAFHVSNYRWPTCKSLIYVGKN